MRPVRGTPVVVLLIVALMASGGAARAAAQSPKQPALRDSILALDAGLRKAREALFPEGATGGAILRPADDGAMQQMVAKAAEAALRAGAMLDAYGWPGKSLVGDEASHAMLRLVRSGKLPLKRKALDLLRTAAAAGEASALDLAYLDDDVHVALGEPQLYGTALRWADNRMVPALIADSASVDERRARVGLGPLADSVAAIKIAGLPSTAIKPPGR